MLSGDAKSSAPMIILLCNYLKINKQEQTDTESKKKKKKDKTSASIIHRVCYVGEKENKTD